MKELIVAISLYCVIYTGRSSAQSVDSGITILRNEISKELALKLTGTQYAVAITTKEEVDLAINQKMYADLYGLLGKYLEENLKLKGFAFTETQLQQLTSRKEISVCDLVMVELNTGKFYRTLGALGVYRKAYLQFRFCDESIYRVMLSEISVDGYSYHPNRFAAAFKRISKPNMVYSEKNRLSLKKLPVLASRAVIDSLIANHRNVFEGEYQSLGFDKASPSYSIAIVEIDSKLYGLYTGGGNQFDWETGEVKVELTPTKSDKIFICNWYNRSKIKIENVTLIFDDENTLSVKFNDSEERFVKVK